MDDEGNIIVADSRNDRIQVRSHYHDVFLYYVFNLVNFRCFPPLEYFCANLVEKGPAQESLTGPVASA